MRMHIIGVGTTFMTGLAVLARQAGHDVTGSDSCIDLPTRKKLTEVGVILKEGFSASHLADKPELVVIGNELSSTNEELLEARKKALPYISGSLWLEEFVLHDKWANSMPPHYGDDSSKKSLNKFTEKPAKHAPKPHSESSTKRIVR